MICNFLVSALILLSYVSATRRRQIDFFDLVNPNEEATTLVLNYHRNGTIAAKSVAHFILEDPAVKSGYGIVYSFTLVS